MTGLDRKAHRLVELARSAGDPTAAQLLRLHGALAARIAADGATAASAALAGSKAAGTSVLSKGLVTAGALALGAAGYWALPPRPPTAAPAPAVVRAAARPQPAAPVAAPAAPAMRADSVQSAAPSLPSKAPKGLRLQDEAALLSEVQGSLRGGRPGEALAKLDSYDRRFSTGMLRAEADAARVFALCAAGRVDKARKAAARFVQRYPNAPVTARVQLACK